MSRQYNDHYFSSGQYCVDYPEDHLFVPVAGCPGYFVCEEGYITRDGIRPLALGQGDDHGHKSVKMSANGKTVEKYVHRIVAEAFIPNPDNLPIVRHLNDDPSDNRVENLAWGTQYDNMHDAMRNGTFVGITEDVRRASVEKCSRPVMVTKIETGDSEIFESLNEACRSKNLTQSNAWKVVHGDRPHHKGYRLEYIDKE